MSMTHNEHTRREEFRGLTRADVASAVPVALEGLSVDDRAMVEGEAPFVILGLAFRRVQSARVSAGFPAQSKEESDHYDHMANLASAASIFGREDDPSAAADALAVLSRIENEERAAEEKRRFDTRKRMLAAEWASSERHGKYRVRTEERGHDIVAVYVIGPSAEAGIIDRAMASYAQAAGLRPSGAAGGGEFFNGEYIAQRSYRRVPKG